MCPGHVCVMEESNSIPFLTSIGKNGKGQLKLGWKMLVPMCSWRQGENENFPMPTKPWLGVLVRCRTTYWESLSTQFHLFLTLLLSILIHYPVQPFDWFDFSSFWDIVTEASSSKSVAHVLLTLRLLYLKYLCVFWIKLHAHIHQSLTKFPSAGDFSIPSFNPRESVEG